MGGIVMGPEQINDLKKELEELYSAINFLENIISMMRKEVQEYNVSEALLNNIIDLTKLSVMKFIESRLTTIIDNLDIKED